MKPNRGTDRRSWQRVIAKQLGGSDQTTSGSLYALEVLLLDPRDNQFRVAEIVNISTSGICIRSDIHVAEGHAASLKMQYHGNTFDFSAKVRWLREDDSSAFLMGLKIINRDVTGRLLGELLAGESLIPGSDRRRRESSRDKGENLSATTRISKKGVKIIRIPHDDRFNYDVDYVTKRRDWLSDISGVKFEHIAKNSIDPNDVRGNVENFVGAAQIPIGIVGPIQINGDYANGVYYVPLATTEGGLITTYQRGAIAIAKAGGAKVRVYKDENYLDPIFVFKNLEHAERMVDWVGANIAALAQKVSEVTSHGKLIQILPIIIGRRVVLKVSYQTEDAMGANMINFATEAICQHIAKNIAVESYMLRSNYSSEKKASGANLMTTYGKEVYVEVVLPRRVVQLYLNSTPEKIAKAWHSWAVGSINAGMLGINAQLANGLCGIFIACGQDVAHITNASVGINMLELLDNGDLYASLKLPNLIIGTVGGGTALGTQRECLQMIGCYGKGKARKLAEIVAATLLAGELGICSGLTSGEFLAPHVKASIYTKAKANKE